MSELPIYELGLDTPEKRFQLFNKLSGLEAATCSLVAEEIRNALKETHNPALLPLFLCLKSRLGAGIRMGVSAPDLKLHFLFSDQEAEIVAGIAGGVASFKFPRAPLNFIKSYLDGYSGGTKDLPQAWVAVEERAKNWHSLALADLESDSPTTKANAKLIIDLLQYGDIEDKQSGLLDTFSRKGGLLN